MQYTVRVYAIVHFPITVEANNQQEAMEKVDAETDLHAVLDRHGVEWAEDIDCYLVDEENDPEYERSVWYDKHHAPV